MLQGPHLVVSPNCHREWGRQRTDWGTSGSADNAAGSEKPNSPGRWGKHCPKSKPKPEEFGNHLGVYIIPGCAYIPNICHAKSPRNEATFSALRTLIALEVAPVPR